MNNKQGETVLRKGIVEGIKTAWGRSLVVAGGLVASAGLLIATGCLLELLSM